MGTYLATLKSIEIIESVKIITPNKTQKIVQSVQMYSLFTKSKNFLIIHILIKPDQEFLHLLQCSRLFNFLA